MKTKYNKRLIVSGVLFIIETVCYTLYQILLSSYIKDFYGAVGFTVAWENIIFTTICAIILAFYCFVLHKTKAERNVYLLGVCAFALLNIYFILSVDGRFDFYVVSDILFLAITVLMIMAKIKTNKGVFIIGTSLFVAYALTQFMAVVGDLLNNVYIGGIVWLAFYVYLIAEFIAFFNLWLVECDDLICQKSQAISTKTPLGNDLIHLKQLLDNGEISEDEYNRKKTEILNKL